MPAGNRARPSVPGTSDRALSFGSLEHFRDVPGALRELRRVLRPEARAALVVPNFYVRTERPHERTERRGRWRRLIEGADLVVERVGADLGPPVLQRRTARPSTCLEPPPIAPVRRRTALRTAASDLDTLAPACVEGPHRCAVR